MTSILPRVALAASLLLAAACGGAPPPPPAPPPAPAPAPAPAEPEVVAPAAWSEGLTKPQQIAFMKKNVSPRMAAVFKEHAPAKYAEFGCKTCHGPQYLEPKAYLPKLTFKDGKITSFAEKPEISKFMHERVVPEMASALGKAPYDPATNKGFGCMGCHTVDMK